MEERDWVIRKQLRPLTGKVIGIAIVLGGLFAQPVSTLSMTSVAVAANENVTSVIVTLNGGEPLELRTAPYVSKEGGIMLPAEEMTSLLQGTYTYDERSKSGVLKSIGYEIKFTVGNRFLNVDTKVKTLEFEPEIKEGVVMVPLEIFERNGFVKTRTNGNQRVIDFQSLPKRQIETVNKPPMDTKIQADWKTFKTDHFQVYYYSNEERVLAYSYQYDRIYDYLYSRIGHGVASAPLQEDKTRTPVIFMEQDDFLKVLGGTSKTVVGFWRSKGNEKFLAMKQGKSDSAGARGKHYDFFRHELTHAMTLSSPESKPDAKFPYWMKEGVGMYYEVESETLGTSYAHLLRTYPPEMTYKWSELGKGPTPVEERARKTTFNYGQSESIWRYLATTYGESAVLSLFYAKDEFPASLEKLAGKSINDIEKEWFEFYKRDIMLRNDINSDKDSEGNEIYYGFYKDGLYDGYGRLITEDGVYLGDFVKGKQNGKGKWITKSGRRLYVGPFKDGLFHGLGLQYTSEGYYEGLFENGKKEGTGNWYDLQGMLKSTATYHEDQLVSETMDQEE